MNKADPIPDTIQQRPGGLDCATCVHCGGHITRTRMPEKPIAYPWWHVTTARVKCAKEEVNL